MYGKGFLGNMMENLQADCVQSRQAGFMQRFLNTLTPEPQPPQGAAAVSAFACPQSKR